jgi:hypothetical protein
MTSSSATQYVRSRRHFLLAVFFMDFLGLGISGVPPALRQHRTYSRPDDVKVTDLGGTFVTLSDVAPAERDVLANAYHLANKANAHLTHGASFTAEAGIVHKAIPMIDALLRRISTTASVGCPAGTGLIPNFPGA